jgi:hypothetical protein
VPTYRFPHPRRYHEGGFTVVFLAVGLLTLLAVAALAVDYGILVHTRTRLQGLADASALAAVVKLPSQANVVAAAQQYANYNDSENGPLVATDEVVIGNWDPAAGTFTPDGEPNNAVRVVARRTAERNNAVALWFAKTLGMPQANVAAWATATVGGGVETPVRFLIDEELIDSDIPAIEALARQMGKPSDHIIRDNDGDWYIDLPVGTKLQLPTGQTGDQGLFEIQEQHFPFTDQSSPSFADFLNWTEHIDSRSRLVPKSMLDPLTGVHAVNSNAEYPSFISPGTCQVSPIYKSDVNAPPPPENGGPEEVKALGERRGLLAFSLDSLGTDPDGSGGSKFYNIWITVCPPIADLDQVGLTSTLRIQLVQ